MKKKMFALILTVCIVIGMMPTSAMALAAMPEEDMPSFVYEENQTKKLHEIFSGDQLNHIEKIVFRGDYTFDDKDKSVLNKPHLANIELQSGRITMTSDISGLLTQKEISVSVNEGAQLIIGGEEKVGAENAEINILSGGIILRLKENAWFFYPGSKIVVQKGEHEKNLLGQNSSLGIVSKLKILEEGFFLKANDGMIGSMDLQVTGILEIDNGLNFKFGNIHDLQDAELNQFITIHPSGRVIFKNSITPKQAQALFKNVVKSNDDGITWTSADASEEPKPEPNPSQEPKPEPPVSSGSSSQSSVRPDPISKPETIKDSDVPQTEAPNKDSKSEEKKKDEQKPEEKKSDKADPIQSIVEKVSTTLSLDEKKYTAVIDGVTVEKTMDVAPKIHQGKPVLPARMISELLGVSVQYNGASKTASFTYGENNKVELTLGQKFMLVNGKKIELSAEVLNVDGRILLPLTDIQKAFADLGLKANVGWDANSKSITIDK